MMVVIMKIVVEMNSIPMFYLLFLCFNFLCNTIIWGDFFLCFLELFTSSLGPKVGYPDIFLGHYIKMLGRYLKICFDLLLVLVNSSYVVTHPLYAVEA